MFPDRLEDRVAAVRRFNRFFTREIGALREGLLHSPYTLTEARIIFEIAHRTDMTAAHLGRELGLDAGYLSRTLGHLESRGVLEKIRSEHDGRQRLLKLTQAGREAFSLLDARSRDEVTQLLTDLSAAQQERLLEAMACIEGLLSEPLKFAEPFYLRAHEPGDLGWVVERHGALYAREYGWDSGFEALVAMIAAEFLERFDPNSERCWIAEMNGERVGCVFCLRSSEDTAKLRLLLVEPKARGLGLGKRLVEECVRFARARGYQRLTLWTNDVLTGARRIYEQTGFHLVKTEAHHSFGHDLVGETWEREL